MPLIEHRFAGKKYHKIGDRTELIVVHTGPFELDNFIFWLHEYLMERGWCSRNESDFKEVLFLQRETQGGNEIFIKWRCSKASSEPVWSFEMDLDMHLLGIKKKEIVVEGKKKELDSGEVEVKIFPRMIVNDAYNKGFFGKYYDTFIQRIAKGKFESVNKEFYEEITRFMEALKEYFGIEKRSPELELGKFYGTKFGTP